MAVFFGDAFNNVLIGTNSSDILVGEGGSDTLFGTSGSDILAGDAVGDIPPGLNVDVVDYSTLSTDITLETQGRVVKTGAGTDQLRGIEVIIGNANFINTIDGGSALSGTTAFDVDLGAESLSILGVPTLGTINFTVQNFSDVIGTGNDDTLAGGSGNNALLGGLGNDLLIGSAGNDILSGETATSFADPTGIAPGTDFDTADYSNLTNGVTLLGQGTVDKDGLGTDQLFGMERIVGSLNGPNAVDGEASTVTRLAVNLQNGTLAVNDVPGLGTVNFDIENFDDAFGTNNNDTLTGNDMDNLLVGRLGNDTFTGSLGNDTLSGDDATGFLSPLGITPGIDTDTVNYSGLGGEITLLSTGAVLKSADGSFDQLLGIERIIAGSGSDTIDGGQSNTTRLNVDLTNQTATILGVPDIGALSFTVQGFDDVFGTNNDDTIVGDTTGNILFSNAGDDLIFGGNGAGQDIIGGGTGDDTIIGSAASDDLYVYRPDWGNEQITDPTGANNFTINDIALADTNFFVTQQAGSSLDSARDLLITFDTAPGSILLVDAVDGSGGGSVTTFPINGVGAINFFQGGVLTSSLAGTAIVPTFLDDVGGPGLTAPNLGSLDVGRSVTGALEKDGDVDTYEITLQAGIQYIFALTGAVTESGNLVDPVLTLRDASGVTVAFDDDGGVGLESLIVFTPATSGTFFLDARGFSVSEGSYTLRAQELAKLTNAQDDLLTATEGDVLFANLFVDNGNGEDTNSPEIVEVLYNGRSIALNEQVVLDDGSNVLITSNGLLVLEAATDTDQAFTYTVSDGAFTDTEVALVTVDPAAPAPQLAADDIIDGTIDQGVIGNLFVDNGNGIDTPRAGALTLVSVNGVDIGGGLDLTLESGALLSVDPDGDFALVPVVQSIADINGGIAQDSFTYTVEDAIGEDTARVQLNVDVAAASLGTDGDDNILESSADNIIIAGDGDDRVFARGGDDIIIGGGGNDSLQGVSGDNTLIGGDGADAFIFNIVQANNGDVNEVVDLDFNQGDRLLLQGFSTNFFDDSVVPSNRLGLFGPGTGVQIDSFDDFAELRQGGAITVADVDGAFQFSVFDPLLNETITILVSSLAFDAVV